MIGNLLPSSTLETGLKTNGQGLVERAGAHDIAHDVRKHEHSRFYHSSTAFGRSAIFGLIREHVIIRSPLLCTNPSRLVLGITSCTSSRQRTAAAD
jgi:hypothetical protein